MTKEDKKININKNTKNKGYKQQQYQKQCQEQYQEQYEQTDGNVSAEIRGIPTSHTVDDRQTKTRKIILPAE